MYNQETYQRYLDHWLLAVDSTIQYIASSAYGIPETAFLPYWQDQHLSNAMDSLSWFAGGNIILGGIVTGNQSLIDFGLRIADTAGLVYSSTATGLGGEYVVWSSDCEEKDMQDDLCAANHSFAFSSTAFNLRPEVIETWYYAYRATRDVKYREMAWNVFIGLEEFCKTRTGYSAISNVSHSGGGQKLDEQDSFLFAEVLKYLWLIHSDVRTCLCILDIPPLTHLHRMKRYPFMYRTAGSEKAIVGFSILKHILSGSRVDQCRCASITLDRIENNAIYHVSH